jgi:SAM-dependent methyltransferase
MDQLEAAGMLVDPVRNESDVELCFARSQQLLKQLPAQLYRITADVQGLGPFAEKTLRDQEGTGVSARLFALGSAMDGLSQALSTLRLPHVQQQASVLGLSAESENLKLHLGCGPVLLEGFVNIDIYPAQMCMNVLWGLPFDDGKVRIVYLSHLLEHLFYPNDVNSLLTECARVLVPGGLIRVVVPDIARCLRAYQEQDQSFFDARRENFSWWPAEATALENFLTYAGVGPEPRFVFEAHKYGYDFATLSKALAAAGFSEIKQSEFQQSAEPELHVEHLSEAARWRAGDEYLSLFVEARKT